MSERQPASRPLRALHVSDLHVDTAVGRMLTRGELTPKRLLGAANLWLRRGPRFKKAREKIVALAALAEELEADLIFCTGDYTVLGTELELRRAREAIAPLLGRPMGLLTVPGNHDVYERDCAREARFARHFGDLLTTDLPEHAGPDGWPWVRLLGEHVAAIGVDSTRPNPQLWRSSGEIPAAQLAALGRVLRDPALEGRFVFVLTHYAPRRPDGSPDSLFHRMDNAEDFLSACAPIARGAVLHGHIHHALSLALPGVGPRIFGAGSSTEEGRGTAWSFEIAPPSEGLRGRARLYRWDGLRYSEDGRELDF